MDVSINLFTYLIYKPILDVLGKIFAHFVSACDLFNSGSSKCPDCKTILFYRLRKITGKNNIYFTGEVLDWAKEEVDDFVEPEEEGYPLHGITEEEHEHEHEQEEETKKLNDVDAVKQ